MLNRKEVKIRKVSVIPLNLGRGKDRVRYAYLIEGDKKRVVYAPCSIFGMKIDKFYENLDLLLIETGWFGKTKKIRAVLPADHVWQDHVSFEENIELIKKIKPKRTILTHFEGSRHIDYDQMKEKIKPYTQKFNIEVAYDGMVLEV